MNLPNHIVVVPDGNRRWAKKRGWPSFFGHREGAKTTGKILEAALDLKIPYFTFWGTSLDNVTKRPSSEVKFLLNLFERDFKKLIKDKKIYQNGVKVNVFGRWEKLFPEKTKKAIKEAIEKTKNHKNCQLTFLLAYSGVDEMASAIQRIAKIKNQNAKIKIDEKLIKNNLWTKDLPAVDLMIRTGGERQGWSHFSSGLMMWDMADAQFYFTKNLFPDFSVAEFKKVIAQYSQTKRKMGA
ncbi:MAG: polyprenyl diphosphate synthase [bacterium]|nr:polyprenyl diphosphate synthase [bacterium]